MPKAVAAFLDQAFKPSDAEPKIASVFVIVSFKSLAC
jgi:hypothetical protein